LPGRTARTNVYWLLEPDELDPPLPAVPPGIAFETAWPRSEAVSFTVLTTLLITLRALESAPPFFFEDFFDAFFAGAFFAAFFAGAFFEAAFFEAAFFDAAFFAGAFFDAFFAAFLLAFFEDDFAADFFAAGFFAAFFADFLDDFFADFFFEDFFLAAMDFSPIQNQVGGEPYVVRKKKIVLRGNRVAQISM
jgi:hypothetical protein